MSQDASLGFFVLFQFVPNGFSSRRLYSLGSPFFRIQMSNDVIVFDRVLRDNSRTLARRLRFIEFEHTKTTRQDHSLVTPMQFTRRQTIKYSTFQDKVDGTKSDRHFHICGSSKGNLKISSYNFSISLLLHWSNSLLHNKFLSLRFPKMSVAFFLPKPLSLELWVIGNTQVPTLGPRP